MPSSKPKYSGLLSNSQVEIIDRFCQLHDCSKSEVIGILLDQWDKNDRPKLDTQSLNFDEDKLTKLVRETVANQVSNLNSNQLPNDLSYSTLAFHVAKNDELIDKVSNRVKNLLAPLEQLRKEITIDILNQVVSIVSRNDDKGNENEEENNTIGNDLSPLEENLKILLPSRVESRSLPPKDKTEKLTISSNEDAIEFLRSVPKELSSTKLEKVLELPSTYISKYKKDPNERRFDRVRPVLDLLTPPASKYDRWVNSYGEEK